jgi:hypothetical protein
MPHRGVRTTAATDGPCPVGPPAARPARHSPPRPARLRRGWGRMPQSGPNGQSMSRYASQTLRRGLHTRGTIHANCACVGRYTIACAGGPPLLPPALLRMGRGRGLGEREKGLTFDLEPRPARTLPSGDESAMNRARVVTTISSYASSRAPGVLPILSAAGSLACYSREARRASIRLSMSRSRASACFSRRAPSGPPCLLARSLTPSSRERCCSSWANSSAILSLPLVMPRW